MFWRQDGVTVHCGDCLEILPGLESGSVNCCVTSPPYWGLRDYGHGDQLGLEATPEEYVANMVDVFREVRRVLRNDGTLWLNLGDSYAGSGKGRNADGSHQEGGKQGTSRGTIEGRLSKTSATDCKTKDLVGIPWMVAFALRADGWYLRQDIIWAKPNPMPESVRDRCTKSHEYIFLLSKSARYYYDHEAIKEPMAASSVSRLSQDVESQDCSNRVPGKTNGPMRAVQAKGNRKTFRGGGVYTGGKSFDNDIEATNDSVGNEPNESGLRNKRSVWTVATKSYKGAHFATFPPKLIEPCILAGCPEGGTVLDPFAGSGTTAMVSQENGRNFVGCELNPEYIELIKKRFPQRSLLLEA